jgi:hypothetical protein
MSPGMVCSRHKLRQWASPHGSGVKVVVAHFAPPEVSAAAHLASCASTPFPTSRSAKPARWPVAMAAGGKKPLRAERMRVASGQAAANARSIFLQIFLTAWGIPRCARFVSPDHSGVTVVLKPGGQPPSLRIFERARKADDACSARRTWQQDGPCHEEKRDNVPRHHPARLSPTL